MQNKTIYPNDMYYFVKTAVITFYGKCLEHPNDTYYESFLKPGLNVYDYTDFVEKLYKNYYKEK